MIRKYIDTLGLPLLTACALLISACELDPNYYDEKYFSVLGGYVRNATNNLPLKDIPVGIYVDNYSNTGASHLDLTYKCLTDKDGLFSFVINAEDYQHVLYSPEYMPHMLRTSSFDSTQTGWKYYDTDQLSVTYINTFYTDTSNFSYVVPSGWVIFNILDFKTDTIVIECDGTQSVRSNSLIQYLWPLQFYKQGTASWTFAEFLVEPSKIHRFYFYKLAGGKKILLKNADYFIKNSFDRTSTPENLKIKADIININIYN